LHGCKGNERNHPKEEEDTMKYFGRAEQVAAKILDAFKNGDVPKALAPIFIRRKDGVPCRSWSLGNQLLCILSGTNDARGMKQWNDVGRKVKKGSTAFDILVPLTRTVTVPDIDSRGEKTVTVLRGFRTAAVFAVESTEGEELPKVDEEVTHWLNDLSLKAVAQSWGLKIDAYDGKEYGPQGQFRPNRHIAVGVKNLSTWCHELVHAADFRLGALKKRGQHWRSETVAELGGAILLEALGMDYEADRGGCWNYIQHYAAEAGIEPIQACNDVLKRTCEAVNLLLAEAGKFALATTL
jgi:hypothetical protein